MGSERGGRQKKGRKATALVAVKQNQEKFAAKRRIHTSNKASGPGGKKLICTARGFEQRKQNGGD